MSKLDDLRNILKALQSNTQPCDGHTDPNSIIDCWNEAFEILNDIEDLENEFKQLVAQINE